MTTARVEGDLLGMVTRECLPDLGLKVFPGSPGQLCQGLVVRVLAEQGVVGIQLKVHVLVGQKIAAVELDGQAPQAALDVVDHAAAGLDEGDERAGRETLECLEWGAVLRQVARFTRTPPSPTRG